MAKLSVSHPVVLRLALGVGVGLSILAALFVGRWEVSNQQTRFQRQIESLATALQRSLNRYTDVLAFLGDYYVVTQGQVERQEFSNYVARSLNTYPGIQALEWAPLVQQADRLAFERTIQAEGYPNFQITELTSDNRLVRAGDRPYYIPVTYVVPFANNEAAFGFDLNSNPARAVAIEFARDQGKITATGRIRLVQEQRDQFGFLVFLPLYQTATVHDVSSRREQFEGFLLGVFRVSNVVEESLQDLGYEIDFVLYDQNVSADQRFLGRYDAVVQQVMTNERDRPSHSLCSTATHCSRTLTVGQRQWQVIFSPSGNYPFNLNYGAPTTLFVGLVLTASLVLFLSNLNRELTQEKMLNNLKLRFFSMASHELRTPLSTILLSAESLQLNRDELSEAQKQNNIQRIYLTAKRMSQQITDLLTLTRAEVGKLEFNPELLEVEPFCQQVLEELEDSIHQRVSLTSHCQNMKAFWDKKLVRSLLTNLLFNAAKYSPNNLSVQMILRCDYQTAIIEICDRGIGIPVVEQAQIQEAFSRGSNVGDVAGTGLGLAVVKTCVELHRGEWAIESEEGQGTTVTVKLPLE
ncbi:CHASE domain-containing protein [Leptolyngbya sp. FACHB-671]|uniref:CHASE domain-containing sensor histidine kinase n=1 Tax=Leptolyngbya sp. FACHB-671 TaxID=2692812 RepID=UPI0016869A01|nr:CHASE domain-containing protein [Leptolyngbya sp. FACHB-671]MBD2069333.1 CHASE domain-containing protein [Leptolyngbya sp. FACHB-671]